MSWRSGRQLRDEIYIDGVHSENLSAAEDRRRQQMQAASSEYQAALARRFGIAEVALADVEEIVGSSGRGWRVAGVEYRLHEAVVSEDANPREAGVELWFRDGGGVVRYLRPPLGTLMPATRPLSDATVQMQFRPAPTSHGGVEIL